MSFIDLIHKFIALFNPKLVAPVEPARAERAAGIHLVTDAGRALIKKYESCRLTSYEDGAGIWTIGWGHTKGVTEGMTCTQEQADQWFEEDLAETTKAVDGLVPVTLNNNQFSACVSLAYNIGTGKFASSTLLQLLRQGNIAGAADQFPRWDKVAGVPNDGLLKRRNEERQLFITPV